MIYLFTALHYEAAGLIQKLGLRKTADARRFPQFRAEDGRMLLTITGSGPVAAAAAVSSVLTACPPGTGDLVVSYGSCGASDLVVGSTYRAAALFDTDARRAGYPDLLLTSPFPTAVVHTAATVWSGAQESAAQKSAAAALGVRPLPVLHDMEASAVYRAALYYVGQHQMVFLKTVTDCGEHVDIDAFKAIMEDAADDVAGYVKQLAEGVETAGAGNSAASAVGEAAALTNKLADSLHCSVTMKAELSQLVKYLYLSDTDVSGKIEKMFESGELPAKDRQEGKRLLEKLRSEFI